MEDIDVQRSGNMILGHVVYKVIVYDEISKNMKARICPHSNLDFEKDNQYT